MLNERLRKLGDCALITRREFPDKVLRVEYALTGTGRRLSVLIEQIRDLDEQHAGALGAEHDGSGRDERRKRDAAALTPVKAG